MNTFSRHRLSLIGFAVLIIAVLGCAGLDEGSGWEQKLAGKKLTRSKSSGSFSDTYHLAFCSSGEYLGKTETIGMSYGGAGTASMAGEDVERGRWSVTGSTLTIELEDASRNEYQLSEGTDSDVIRLDGTPLRVRPASECP